MCDGRSWCPTDECGCGDEHKVFYCADGSGCISIKQVSLLIHRYNIYLLFSNFHKLLKCFLCRPTFLVNTLFVIFQVCNGQMDCQDASDECICSDVITGARKRGCQPEADKSFNNWAECLTKAIDYQDRYEDKTSPSKSQCDIKQSEEACHLKCQGNSEHCKRINWKGHCLENHMLKYFCSNGDELRSEQGPFLGLHSVQDKSLICDGKFDCASKIDEKNCSDRFLCNDGLRSIYKSQVCDTFPDCNDRSDECQNCLKNGVSSDKEFIGNSILKWVIVFQCPLILILNTISGAKHYSSKMKTKVGKIDRILCLSLTFFDMLMGLYLIVIVTKSFSYQGSYCAHDIEWRTSLQCSVTGSLMAISTQGSLLTAMMMSVTRCNTCLTPFSDKSYRLTIITFAALQLCSITLSLLPIMPINVSSGLKQ